jgi:hypothetical protein
LSEVLYFSHQIYYSMQKTAIELFSGSKTVADVLKQNAWSVVTVDNNRNLHANICIDIMQLQKYHLPESVNFIWASLPCTHFSRAANQKHWKKTTLKYRQYHYEPLTPEAIQSILLLQKTLDIFSWFPGALWLIENPIGRLHHMPAMKSTGHFRYGVNYIDWNHFIAKETYLFTNFHLPFTQKKVQSPLPGVRSIRPSYQRSIVPALLVEFIVNHLPV